MHEFSELRCYKQTEIDSHGKLKFFLEKHSTKEGSWGRLTLKTGALDFVFLDGQGNELSRTRVDENSPPFTIPPSAWHKIIPLSEAFHAQLEFYCTPLRYFNKKYGLGTVHGDLVYVYQTYLSHLKQASILDVGCGSGRNLLYLASLGHLVRGIDHNSNSLNKIQEIVSNEQLSNVHTQLHDLNQPIEPVLEQYDWVLSTVALQFLKPQSVPDLLLKLQESTKVNGYHFLVLPLQSDRYPLPDFFTYLPPKDALYQFYQDSGWSIIEYKETVGHLHKCDESGRQISGVFALLLAQKLR